MDYKRAVIFTDLDGTLLNSAHQVSQGNLAAIRRFIDGGGLFGISTGRMPTNAKMVLGDLPINSWSVVTNGALAYHYVRKEAFGAVELPQEPAAALVEYVLQKDSHINVQVCTADELLFLSDPAYADRDFVDTHQPMRNTSYQESLSHPWMKVLLCAPRAALEPIYEEAVRRRLDEIMELVYSSDTYLEFLPKGVNKGRCLRMLRTLPEFANRTIIAIGDYYNDLEVFREADLAVAVANALPEVKAAAQHQVCGNDEGALADLIDRLIPTL